MTSGSVGVSNFLETFLNTSPPTSADFGGGCVNESGGGGSPTESNDPASIERKRVCKFCGKTCSSSSALLYHTRLHTGERPYVCEFCGKGFIQKVHLQRHVENNHGSGGGGKPFAKSESKSSTHNGGTTTTPARYSNVVPTMVPMGNGNNNTPSVGNRLEALAAQLKQSKAADQIDCLQCGERFNGQLALMEHVFDCHQTKPTGHLSNGYSGSETLFDPTSPFNVNNNNNNTDNNRKNNSVLIDVKEEEMVEETPHSQTPTGRKSADTAKGTAAKVQCQQCDASFGGQIAYLEHVYEAHGDGGGANDQAVNDDPMGMPVETENSSTEMESTSMVHNQSQGVLESVFPHAKLYGRKGSNGRQSTAMEDDEPTGARTCKVCGKLLSSSAALSVHMRAHSGDRPYTCSQMNCAKTFMHQNSLKIHEMTHSGQRPHVCKVCGKAFTTSRTLKIHVMIHTGERPYGCKFCGNRFIQQIHLLRHIKSHIRKGSKVVGPGPTGSSRQETFELNGKDNNGQMSEQRKSSPSNESNQSCSRDDIPVISSGTNFPSNLANMQQLPVGMDQMLAFNWLEQLAALQSRQQQHTQHQQQPVDSRSSSNGVEEHNQQLNGSSQGGKCC